MAISEGNNSLGLYQKNINEETFLNVMEKILLKLKVKLMINLFLLWTIYQIIRPKN